MLVCPPGAEQRRRDQERARSHAHLFFFFRYHQPIASLHKLEPGLVRLHVKTASDLAQEVDAGRDPVVDSGMHREGYLVTADLQPSLKSAWRLEDQAK